MNSVTRVETTSGYIWTSGVSAEYTPSSVTAPPTRWPSKSSAHALLSFGSHVTHELTDVWPESVEILRKTRIRSGSFCGAFD